MMNNSGSASVQVRDLIVVRSGRAVLRQLSFSIPAGQVTGLLGPSGCGKSTLMRALVGVQRVASGDVLVLGRPAGSAELRHTVGYVTQAASVYADLTVRENLRFFVAVLGAPTSDVDRVLDQVDLRGYADNVVARLSGGQRSRGRCAALLGSPECSC
jgi:ABC-2 type transport system ATP-binding protein